MGSAWYVLGLALGRVRRRDGGALVAALGIAAAAAVLAGILAGATVAKDRGVAQDVDRLPASARAVRAVWFGVPAGDEERWRALDRSARKALEPLPAGVATAVALVRESTVGGTFVGLAAVDGLAPHVLLRSGRLPRTCTAERCEVLRLRGAGALPDVPGLRVVQVGTATLRSRLLFGDFLAPTDNALADAEIAPALRDASQYHRPPPAPLVVAEGVDGLVSSPVLARSYRSYAWVQRARRRDARLWQIDELVDRRGYGPGGARGAVVLLVADRADAGAPRGRARRDRRGPPAAARRRRGRGAARRLRRPRRGRHAARSRGRAPPPHVARCPPLAGRAPHGHGVRRRRLRRRARRLGHRRRPPEASRPPRPGRPSATCSRESVLSPAGSCSALRPPPSRPL